MCVDKFLTIKSNKYNKLRTATLKKNKKRNFDEIKEICYNVIGI